VGFWKINPADFQSEFLAGPNPPPQLLGLNGNCRPLFREGRIYVSGGGDVWSFDLERKIWHAPGLPKADYTLYEANHALWAFYGKGPFLKRDASKDQDTGLYRLNPTNDTAALIFSTRRRPAEHPLDNTEIAASLGLFSGADGQPVIGLIGRERKYVWLKDGSPWSCMSSSVESPPPRASLSGLIWPTPRARKSRQTAATLRET
jgi:hypothetical protein